MCKDLCSFLICDMGGETGWDSSLLDSQFSSASPASRLFSIHQVLAVKSKDRIRFLFSLHAWHDVEKRRTLSFCPTTSGRSSGYARPFILFPGLFKRILSCFKEPLSNFYHLYTACFAKCPSPPFTIIPLPLPSVSLKEYGGATTQCIAPPSSGSGSTLDLPNWHLSR